MDLLPFLLLFLPFTTTTAAALHGHLSTLNLSSSLLTASSTPTTYFEIRRPITKTSPRCSTLLLSHSFANTYNKPPTTSPYTPPTCLTSSQKKPYRIVLEFSATSLGRQFDRIFAIWLSGIELLRSCTAEPRPNGIFWKVLKDVTRYSALFSHPQTLSVFLANIVDNTYTGIYHVNISIHFHFESQKPRKTPPGFHSPADLILPISRELPLRDGQWFVINNSTDFKSKKLVIPENSYRAVLEVYLSFHQSDEFWYSNPPNSYIDANNLTETPGNGPFREVVARIDGRVVGAVWPFTVIYTGGVNPLLWRPISGIGSFDLPSYDIEITPFLGGILDGEEHEFGFGVTEGLDVWFVDANLHLWLDGKGLRTSGGLIEYKAPDYVPSLVSEFQGLDGRFKTSASRKISATGWVNSSYGKITTHFYQTLEFENLMVFEGNGSIQIVNQTINSNYGIYTKQPSEVMYSEQVFKNFPLYMYSGTTDEVNGSYSSIANVSLGFNENKFSGEKNGFSYSSLRNLQMGQGVMDVKGHLVTRGLGSTQQVYVYESTDGCYFRNVSSSNYTILYDESDESCTKSLPLIGRTLT